MALKEIMKQVSFPVPVRQWKLIQKEAARRKVPMLVLFREWVNPHLEKLEKEAEDDGLHR